MLDRKPLTLAYAVSHLVLLWLSLLMGGLMVRTAARASPSQPANPSLADLVFVVDDLAVPAPGCDAISVFRIDSGAALVRGSTHSSPARLAATSDFRYVLAAPSQTWGPAGFLYGLRRDDDTWEHWSVEAKIQMSRLAPVGGIAVLGDNDSFLVATVGAVPPDGVKLPAPPPYAIEKYRLSEIVVNGDEWRAGLPHGRLAMPGIAAEILPAPDGRLVHVVTENGWLVTVHSLTMTESGAAIPLAPAVAGPPDQGGYHVGLIHATMTADGRYVITNRAFAPQLNVADVVTRQAWILSASGDVAYTGGVAINRGWVNSGVLALHALDKVILYDLSPKGPLRELGRIDVAAPTPGGLEGASVAIAWSATGAEVIAASEVKEQFVSVGDFSVFAVTDGGRRLSKSRDIKACDVDGATQYLPSDILTANGKVTPPPMTTTPVPSPPATPTRTPTVVTSPTATDTPAPVYLTLTATPTPQPVFLPPSIYLPLALDEVCKPGKTRLDVALVMDASSTMLEPTRAGRTKMDAARQAATELVALLSFPGDQAAVVWFNEVAVVEQGLTDDRPALDAALDRIGNRQFTRIDLGIAVAQAELEGPRHHDGSQAIMIVLTDGGANPLSPEVGVERARDAKAHGTEIFTIGLGNSVDGDALARMASRPDYYYQTPDAENLTAIYRQVAVTAPCPPEWFWGRRRQ
jgi:Mg-chelatase subunit ChlD